MHGFRHFLDVCLAWSLYILGRIAGRVLLKIEVTGRDGIPIGEPLIVTSNHFSWFDAPLLTFYLPFRPTFLIATESQRFWFVRLFMRAYDGIPIWRGQPDRDALEAALARLASGDQIGIFPEGGIDPRLVAQRERGAMLTSTYGHTSRLDAQLTYPQPGAVYLALHSGARILPVGLIGTEQILGNLLRLRRTRVKVRIGVPFGPLAIDPALDRCERREQIHEMADQVMLQIAELFPPENRGPYRRGALRAIA
jgi:1-acyl-sn-glycerol-3-phosphate acyltransferase